MDYKATMLTTFKEIKDKLETLLGNRKYITALLANIQKVSE